MDVPGIQPKQQEGPVAREIEKRTSRIPSDFFLWAGLASMATSLGFMLAGRKEDSIFVGQWAPVFLVLGVYNKIVKTQGSDVYTRELH